MGQEAELDAVAREIGRLARSRAGKLVGVSLGAPRAADGPALASQLSQRLVAGGWDGVEVRVVPEGPRLRLIHLEFAR